MRIYFLRHGKAVEPGSPKYPTDFDRPLTKPGIKEMLDEADAMARLKVDPEVILTSPLVRSRQTAEIVADMLGLRKHVIEVDALGEHLNVTELKRILRDHASCESVMLVGHEPYFSETIRGLIGGGEVALKRGGLARVDFANTVAAGQGRLVWLLAPRVLVELGRKLPEG